MSLYRNGKCIISLKQPNDLQTNFHIQEIRFLWTVCFSIGAKWNKKYISTFKHSLQSELQGTSHGERKKRETVKWVKIRVGSHGQAPQGFHVLNRMAGTLANRIWIALFKSPAEDFAFLPSTYNWTFCKLKDACGICRNVSQNTEADAIMKFYSFLSSHILMNIGDAGELNTLCKLILWVHASRDRTQKLNHLDFLMVQLLARNQRPAIVAYSQETSIQ